VAAATTLELARGGVEQPNHPPRKIHSSMVILHFTPTTSVWIK